MILNGQVGWWSGTVNATPSTPALWTNIYAVYNADSVGSSSLKTSLYAAYNGESNANDSFGSNNGTAQGGLTYTAGKIGNAFQFNGTNSYILLPTGSMRFTNSFSVSMWTYTTANQTANKGLLSDYYWPGDLGYSIYMTSSNKVQTYFLGNGNTTNDFTSNSTLANNQWNHIVVSWDKANTQWKVYVNGVLDNTYTNANASVINYGSYSSDRTDIGAINSSPSGVANVFNGKIDALNVWNKALTQSEITELYNSGNGAQYITNDFYKPTTNDALNTYNGTAQGGLTYGVGKVGTAFQFNGTNAYVELGDVMDVGISNWTYSFWFKTNDAVNVGVCFSKSFAGGSSGRFWGGYYNNRFAWNFQADTNVIYTETNNGSIVNNTWYHVVCVIDRNDKLKLYINGSLQTLNVTSGTNNLTPYVSYNFNTNNPFRIGAYTDSNNTTAVALINGSIDAFNVWNKVLTQTEITELYNSGNGKQYPN